jgi:hypothetical protein
MFLQSQVPLKRGKLFPWPASKAFLTSQTEKWGSNKHLFENSISNDYMHLQKIFRVSIFLLYMTYVMVCILSKGLYFFFCGPLHGLLYIVSSWLKFKNLNFLPRFILTFMLAKLIYLLKSLYSPPMFNFSMAELNLKFPLPEFLSVFASILS